MASSSSSANLAALAAVAAAVAPSLSSAAAAAAATAAPTPTPAPLGYTPSWLSMEAVAGSSSVGSGSSSVATTPRNASPPRRSRSPARKVVTVQRSKARRPRELKWDVEPPAAAATATTQAVEAHAAQVIDDLQPDIDTLTRIMDDQVQAAYLRRLVSRNDLLPTCPTVAVTEIMASAAPLPANWTEELDISAVTAMADARVEMAAYPRIPRCVKVDDRECHLLLGRGISIDQAHAAKTVDGLKGCDVIEVRIIGAGDQPLGVVVLDKFKELALFDADAWTLHRPWLRPFSGVAAYALLNGKGSVLEIETVGEHTLRFGSFADEHGCEFSVFERYRLGASRTL